MVGRTPEYLGKKITPREMVGRALFPGDASSCRDRHRSLVMAMRPRAGMLNTGPHGIVRRCLRIHLGGNNNGSAFAASPVNTDWYNTALGLAMVFGRFLPDHCRCWRWPDPWPAGQRTRIDRHAADAPTAVRRMVAGVTLILVALNFLPCWRSAPC